MESLSSTEQVYYVFLSNYIKNIIVSESTGCWFKNRNSTVIRPRVEGLRIQVAVLSAMLFLDYEYPNSKKLIVCHKCDTPACFNPEHLFIGTTQDNLHDYSLKRNKNLTVQERIAISENILKFEELKENNEINDEMSEEELKFLGFKM